MKRLLIPLFLACGFAAGWFMPSLPLSFFSSLNTGISSTKATRNRDREIQKKKLLDELSNPDERQRQKLECAGSLAELLADLKDARNLNNDIRDIYIDRIVGRDPAAALNQWLADPTASGEMCTAISKEWSHRNPEQAIRFLQGKHSYRADDCLLAALVNASRSHPRLVGEVIRSKSRRWQEQHLKDFFSGTYRVRVSSDVSELVAVGSFEEEDDGNWLTKRNGGELLKYLADDELRAKARSFWEENARESPTPELAIVNRKPLVDVVNFHPNDNDQRYALHEQLDKKPEQTLTLLAEQGSFEARKEAIEYVMMMELRSKNLKSWPATLKKLEEKIRRLGVIPNYPGCSFESGEYFQECAHWISRQPLGLQRAWAPAFTKDWVSMEPEAAVKWACSLPENASREQAVQSGMIVWACQKPLEAAAYVEALPPGDLRESSISNTAATWSCVDRGGARRWLESLPESPGKTRALERIK